MIDVHNLPKLVSANVEPVLDESPLEVAHAALSTGDAIVQCAESLIGQSINPTGNELRFRRFHVIKSVDMAGLICGYPQWFLVVYEPRYAHQTINLIAFVLESFDIACKLILAEDGVYCCQDEGTGTYQCREFIKAMHGTRRRLHDEVQGDFPAIEPILLDLYEMGTDIRHLFVADDADVLGVVLHEDAYQPVDQFLAAYLNKRLVGLDAFLTQAGAVSGSNNSVFHLAFIFG